MSNHRLRSVVINQAHVWECRHCGKRWLANVDVVVVVEAQRCAEVIARAPR